MATLREIDADLRALEDLLAELGGDVTDEEADAAIDEWLKENAKALREKLDGYGTLIVTAQGRADSRKEESDRLAALAHLDTQLVKKLKERLLFYMNGQGATEIQTGYFRFRVAGNGGKQPLRITGDVPEEYTKTEVVVDMAKIRAALESGVSLPFAELEPRGQHLRVK